MPAPNADDPLRTMDPEAAQSVIAREVVAWEARRNAQQARIHWTFTLAAARRKLRNLYLSIED